MDGNFLRSYGRKRRQPGRNANDRTYSWPHEELIKRMDPRDLDALMRGEDETE